MLAAPPSLSLNHLGLEPIGLVAQSASTIRFEWGILDSFSQQPLWLTLAVVATVIALLVTLAIYAAEHRTLGAWAWVAGLLRVAAMVAVLVLLANPMRRTVTTETTPSRVVLLVDTSLSMATPVNDASGPETASSPPLSKHAATLAWLKEHAIPELSKVHRVQVVPLHQPTKPILFPLAKPVGEEATTGESTAEQSPPPAIASLIERLRPTSDQTQFALPLAEVIERASGGPLAGIILVTDGQQNRGNPAEPQAKRLAERGALLHTLGMGPTQPAINSWVRFMSGSSRAYVNDRFRISVAIGSNQNATTAAAQMELYRQVEGKELEKIDSKSLELSTRASEGSPSKGEETIDGSVEFELEETDPSKYRYLAKLLPLAGEAELSDNQRTLDVEVVDRVSRVLMLASGPTRDYRFLRNQLKRDKAFSLDVYLQSIRGPAQQNAESLLEVFPTDLETLGSYDVVVAFDPDWTQLPEGTDKRLEQCVNERGTGLILIPGPVHTDRWLNRRPNSRLRTLLPVTLESDLFAMVERTPFANQVQSVRLTKAGQNADFLMLRSTRDPATSEEPPASSSLEGYQFWESTPLFYSCREMGGLKPATIVYATLGESANQVLLAEQFYGAGRSFYLGSTEFWRLRKESPTLFEGFFTKLMQHVAQGRLTAGDSAGRLLFEQTRYDLGEPIQLRLLVSGQTETGGASQPAKMVRIGSPSGKVETFQMTPSPHVPQAWDLSFRADEQGLYEAIYGDDRAPLTASTRVELPQRERRPVEQNTELLTTLAAAGGGHAYRSIDESLQSKADRPALLDALPSRSEKRTVAGEPDPVFAEQVSRWTLGVICACLFSEWWLRRRARLA